MSNDHDEIQLSGGNVNAGVFRVGNTVRRSPAPSSHSIHRLLQHLEAKGFDGSPRFLGCDEKKREVLSFIEGQVGILTFAWENDDALTSAVRLLKQYHDCTIDFDKDVHGWAFVYPDVAKHEVICHNDFGLYNLVYVRERAVGIIDFDLAGPGPCLRDLAYAAYWLTPLSLNSTDQILYAEKDLTSESRRLKLLCSEYGVPLTTDFIEMIEEVLWQMGDERHIRRMIGDQATEKLIVEGHLRYWRDEAEVFHNNKWRIIENLPHK